MLGCQVKFVFHVFLVHRFSMSRTLKAFNEHFELMLESTQWFLWASWCQEVFS